MKILDNNDGLTLIETLIALTLVVILTAAFAGAMVVALQSETTSDNLDYSSNLSSSIFAFMLDKNNFHDIILDFKANNLIKDADNYVYQSSFLGDQNSFYNDLNGINNFDQEFKKIIDSFKDISSYNLLAEESEIKIDKVITTSSIGDDLVLYRAELIIISEGAKGRQNYSISTILGDLDE